MKGGRLKEIDGLRSVAVVAVILFHYSRDLLPLGYMGVDVFFSISGYVIARSIDMRMQRGTFTLNDFYMRRLKRLFPVLAVVILATLAVSALLLPKSMAFKTGAAALVGASNIALWQAGRDYFGASTEWNPLTHTWSLGVEEQFYLIFPLLFLVFRSQPKNRNMALAAIGAVSLGLFVLLWPSYPTAVFYLPVFRFWELAAGAIVYLEGRRLSALKVGAQRGMWQYALIAVLLCVMYISSLPQNLATVICIGATLGLLYLSSVEGPRNAMLEHPVTQFIGKISYSLYLWHWPVVVFAKIVVPLEWLAPTYFGATAGLATISYVTVERPLREMNWHWFGNSFPVSLAAVGSFAAGAIALLWLARPLLFLGPTDMLQESFLEASACHSPGPKGLDTCLRPDPNGAPTIWLLGDSHAGNYLLSLQTASDGLKARLQYLTGLSLFRSLAGQCDRLSCPEGSFSDLGQRIQAVARTGDRVVLSFSSHHLREEPDLAKGFGASLETLVAGFAKAGLKTTFVEDVPKVCRDDGDYNKSAINKKFCNIPIAQAHEQRKIDDKIYQYLRKNHDARILNLDNELCEEVDGKRFCSNYYKGELLYMDVSPHLTTGASTRLAPFFVRSLQ